MLTLAKQTNCHVYLTQPFLSHCLSVCQTVPLSICLSDCLLDCLSGVGIEFGKIDFKENKEQFVENIFSILKFSN